MHRRRFSIRRLKRILLAPFYSFASSFSGIFGLFSGLLGFGRPRGTRNRDFERAGRPPKQTYSVPDQKAIRNLRQATGVRNREIENAIKLEKKMMRKRGKESEEFWQEKADVNSSVSKGHVVNHLFQVNRKSSEKKDPAPERTAESDSADSASESN